MGGRRHRASGHVLSGHNGGKGGGRASGLWSQSRVCGWVTVRNWTEWMHGWGGEAEAGGEVHREGGKPRAVGLETEQPG